ncbi:MAG: hypothetical protein EOP88_21940 [Verrucomicrobiaceae bacterium]|nr:MAG: hypothetical protein EOP88_21940 [Verrucomicrobiaceae bacterium]
MPNLLQLRDTLEPERGYSYQDYYINGRRLADRMNLGGQVPPLGWFNPEADQRARRLLLLDEEFTPDPGRVPLFVCHWCGDELCGYVAALVTRQGDQVIWSDFSKVDYNSFDADGGMLLAHREIEGGSRLRFSFDAEQYRVAIEKGTQNP